MNSRLRAYLQNAIPFLLRRLQRDSPSPALPPTARPFRLSFFATVLKHSGGLSAGVYLAGSIVRTNGISIRRCFNTTVGVRDNFLFSFFLSFADVSYYAMKF